MSKKKLYAAPETEVLELRLENSVLTESPDLNPGYGEGWTDENI